MNSQVVIIGAGIAGLILFDELIKKNVNVCLIESNDNTGLALHIESFNF